jgi:hypothetical protein
MHAPWRTRFAPLELRAQVLDRARSALVHHSQNPETAGLRPLP